MRKLLICLGLSVLLVAPAGAGEELEPPDLGRYLKWGPFRVRPGVELSNLGYDDNILASSTQKVDDYTATVSPKLDGLVLFGHRTFLTFQERLDFTAYRDNTDQNFVNQKGTARFTLPLRRMGLFAEVKVNRLKERPVDQEDLRPERDEDGLGFGVILEPGWRTTLELGISQTRLRFYDPDFTAGGQTIDERLDRDELRRNLKVKYQLVGRTRLTLDAHLDDIEFRTPTGFGSTKDSYELGLLPGIDFGQGGRLSGRAKLGWTRIKPDNSLLPDFSELVGEAALDYRPNGRTTLRLEAERTPGFTVTEGTVYYLNTDYGLRAIYFLNRSIGVESGASVGTLTFPGSAGAADRDDDIQRYDAGLRLRLAQSSIGRRVEYRLRVVRSRRDSTLDSQDRSRTLVSFGAVLGF